MRFLLSQRRQEELSDLLRAVHELDAFAERDGRLRHVHNDWLDAAERTQATVRQLSEQLRRFLDDQIWFENRRVIEILRGIETKTLKLRDQRDVPMTAELAAPHPGMTLPMERPLYTRVHKSQLDSDDVRDAEEQTDPSVLFEQVYVDPGPLRGNIHRALRRQSSVVLTELIQEQPLTKGLAELVTYLSLKDEAFSIVFDEQQRVIYARGGT